MSPRPPLAPLLALVAASLGVACRAPSVARAGVPADTLEHPTSDHAGALAAARVVLPSDADVSGLRTASLLRADALSAALVSVSEPLRAHYHARHDETVYVLAGRGRMRVGDVELELAPGLLVHVPRGALHSVEPEGVVHALSFFHPPFDGVDRVFVEAAEEPLE